VLETVRVLLPNSRAELAQIERTFGVTRPAVIVPNAADARVFGPTADAGARGTDADRSGVLCVGRLEPRKNQLALLAALRGTGIPVTLVGQAGRFNAGYARQCRAAADRPVRFVARQPPEALRAWYRAARVHACVSWYETPGLASLEAGLGGCALVVTPGGCTREYFGDQAHYCRPDDVSSIHAAVEAALAAGPPAGLAEHIARTFTWDAAAERTLAGYRLALG
jgi:glycosyltransferase involved in cell wall biosynthesis